MELDMSQEQEVVQRELMPEGEVVLKIIKIEPKTSKAGNEMLEWTVMSKDGKCDVICTILTQGKRWALKNILSACNVQVLDGEIYVFEPEQLVDKLIVGINKHIENEFINRKGETEKKSQNKFTKFLPYIKKEDDEEIPF